MKKCKKEEEMTQKQEKSSSSGIIALTALILATSQGSG